MRKFTIEVEYIEKMLGTASANPDLHSEFIASKARDDEDGAYNSHSRDEKMAEEIASLGVDGAIERAMTVFPRLEDGTPFLWDYQWKGFFKDACSMLKRVGGNESARLRAYKKEIDGLVFPYPRRIPLIIPEGGEVGRIERPLRASTAQGERVCLASSETVPEGTVQRFEVMLLRDELGKALMEWLDYGEVRGVGQWRNSGCGRFMYRAEEL